MASLGDNPPLPPCAVKGTASHSYGISKVSSGSTRTSTAATNWQSKAALAVGKKTITLNSVDPAGNKSVSTVLKIVRE